MKSMFSHSGLLLAFCQPFVAHTALAANIVCPHSIIETPNASTEEKGWTVAAPTGKRRLHDMDIYFGSISNHLELSKQMPDSETSSKTIETATWVLPRNKDENDTYWIGCSYLDTSAILFQKVDATVTKCVAMYEYVPGGGSKPQLSGMVCR